MNSTTQAKRYVSKSEKTWIISHGLEVYSRYMALTNKDPEMRNAIKNWLEYQNKYHAYVERVCELQLQIFQSLD